MELSAIESNWVVAPSGDECAAAKPASEPTTPIAEQDDCQNAEVDSSAVKSMVREAFFTTDEIEPEAVAEPAVDMSSAEVLDQGSANKATGLLTAAPAKVAGFLDAARTRSSETFVSTVSHVSDSVNGICATVGDKCLGNITSVRDRCAKVAVYVEDTLIGAGTKVLSYVPTPVKVRIETTYDKAMQVQAAVQDYATRRAASVTRQLASMATSANLRYEAVVSNVSAKFETIKGVVSNTLSRTWGRFPDSIKTRVSVVADFSAAKIIAAQDQANAAWKYASGDPKARTTAKAIAAGATAGGTTGFITGGAVGTVIGIIPALFTFGLSIPLGAAIGSGIGLGCGAAAGGAVGLASGAAYANKAEMARGASMYKAYVKDQASHIHGRASAAMPTVGLRLRSSGA